MLDCAYLLARVLVSLCFFLSGAAALILQVLWTRMLGLVFGATALAVSTTLTAFMGGLALGAFLGGRIAPKLKRPLLAFALLETAVGAYGLLVPGLLSWMPEVQQLMGASLGESFIGYSLVRFIVVGLVLLLPTTAMGATLPILSEGVVKIGRDVASKVGELYSANTFGAVAGAFFAGFVLIPSFGIQFTVYFAAAIDLIVALFVLGLWRAAGGDRFLLSAARAGTPDEVLALLEPVEVEDVTRVNQKLALLAFALSGAAAMALEVLWSRAVGVVIGASTYAFTLILVTFLLGLSVGAAWMTRRVDRVKRPVLWLAWVQVLVGALAVAGTNLVDRMPHLLHAAARSEDVTMTFIYFANFAISALVMLPATLVLGAVMPLVVRILAPHGADHAGPIVGRAYSLNTLGAILGSFAGGFILLPLFGVQSGLKIAAGTSVLVGVALAFSTRPLPKVALGVAGLAAALIAVEPTWNVPAWTSGLFRFYLARSVYSEGWEWSGKLLYHRDGIATTVTVEGSEEGPGVSLKVNGKVDASDVGDMPTQILSGLLPILVHPPAKKVLVIGYGSGVTPGAVLEAPVERVDLVEIEEAVLEASNRFFSHVNNKPFEDPRFFPHVDDGRNFLLTRERTYDVIISEPSNPWMTGASSLFTTDFFNIAKSRLAEDGVFLQWLQLYELSTENVEALFSTFRSVFPHTVVLTPSPRSNDTLVLGSRRPIQFDRDNLLRVLDDPKLRAELTRAEIAAAEDFIGLYIMGDAELSEIAKRGQLNTDDNALIEFRAPRDLLEYSIKDARLRFLETIEGERLNLAPPHFKNFDFEQPLGLLPIAEAFTRQGRLADAHAAVARVRSASAAVDGYALRRLERVEELLVRFEEEDTEAVVVADDVTTKDETYARAIQLMLAGKDRDALNAIEAVEKFEDRGSAHRFLQAYLCYREDRVYDAEYLIEGVLDDRAFVEQYPATLYYAARIAAERGRYDKAFRWYSQFLDRQATKTSTSSQP